MTELAVRRRGHPDPQPARAAPAGARARCARRTTPGPMRVVVVFDQTEPDYLLATTDGVPVLVLSNWRTPGLAGARNTGSWPWTPSWSPSATTTTSGRRTSCAARSPALLAEPAGVRHLRDRGRVRGPGHAPAGRTGRGRRGRAGPLPDGDAALVDVPDPPRGAGRPDRDRAGRRGRAGQPERGLGPAAAGRPPAPIVHVDEPLVRVLWGRTSHYAYEYADEDLLAALDDGTGTRRSAAARPARPGSTASWPAGRRPPATGPRRGSGRGRRSAPTGGSRGRRSRWPP